MLKKVLTLSLFCCFAFGAVVFADEVDTAEKAEKQKQQVVQEGEQKERCPCTKGKLLANVEVKKVKADEAKKEEDKKAAAPAGVAGSSTFLAACPGGKCPATTQQQPQVQPAPKKPVEENVETAPEAPKPQMA